VEHYLTLRSSPPKTPAEVADPAAGGIIAGIHFFILADLLVFTALFVGFMVERAEEVALFNESASILDPWTGILNTLILVTSGVCVVFAVNAARLGRAVIARRWILAAFVIGLGFGISKIVEYENTISLGITMHTNDFYMFYYALTGAHFLHFFGGMAALAVIWHLASNKTVDGPFFGTIESVGLYWHMVDLLWLFIFPLLYLLGT
tara:strand:- start:6201 stop:6818 length:618 start_codon:yes stop_codon:yes gene_type:complete